MKVLHIYSMDILSVLIYEDDLHISKNSYSQAKMKFLISQLGDIFCQKYLTGAFLKIWYLLKQNDYQLHVITNTDIKNQIGVDWSTVSVTDISKKLQKQLEIAWLSKINEDTDLDEDKKKKLIEKFELIFKVKTKDHVTDLQKTIDFALTTKIKRLEDVIQYNKEATEIRDFIEKEMNKCDRAEFTADVGLDIISRCRDKIEVNNTHLNEKFICAKEKLTQYKSKYKNDKIKECKHSYDKMRNLFLRMTFRTIVDKEDLKENQINFYMNMLKELNEIYGYERYVI